MKTIARKERRKHNIQRIAPGGELKERFSFGIATTVSTLVVYMTAREENSAAGARDTSAGEENITAGEENITAGEENITAGEETITAGEETITAGRETLQLEEEI